MTVRTRDHDKIGTTEYVVTVYRGTGRNFDPDNYTTERFPNFDAVRAMANTWYGFDVRVERGTWHAYTFSDDEFGKVLDAEFVTDETWRAWSIPNGGWDIEDETHSTTEEGVRMTRPVHEPDPSAQAYARAIGRKVTKYAELSTRECGKCVDLIDTGTMGDSMIDPTCDDHREYPCPKCGAVISRSTIMHGNIMGFCGTTAEEE